jgi:hypothetical protein
VTADACDTGETGGRRCHRRSSASNCQASVPLVSGGGGRSPHPNANQEFIDAIDRDLLGFV